MLALNIRTYVAERRKPNATDFGKRNGASRPVNLEKTQRNRTACAVPLYAIPKSPKVQR